MAQCSTASDERGPAPLVVHRCLARGRRRSASSSRSPSTARPTTPSRPRAHSRSRRSTCSSAVPESGGRHRHRRVRRAAGRRRSAGAAGDPGEHREPREAAARLERREPDHRHERTVRRQDRARHRAVRHAGARRRPRRVHAVAAGHATCGRRGSRARVRRRGRRLRRTSRRRATPTSSVCSPRSSSSCSRSGRWSRWGCRSSPRCSVSASGVALIHIVAAVTDVGTLAPVLATMIGLGVGIDYSLFIVTRYRENLAAGMASKRRRAARSRPPVRRCCSRDARS